jgi:hypothetical protein
MDKTIVKYLKLNKYKLLDEQVCTLQIYRVAVLLKKRYKINSDKVSCSFVTSKDKNNEKIYTVKLIFTLL